MKCRDLKWDNDRWKVSLVKTYIGIWLLGMVYGLISHTENTQGVPENKMGKKECSYNYYKVSCRYVEFRLQSLEMEPILLLESSVLVLHHGSPGTLQVIIRFLINISQLEYRF